MNAVQGIYAPGRVVPKDAVYLSSLGPNALGQWHHSIREGSSASGANAATNRIHYIPFWLNGPYTVQRCWWLNGATVGTDNAQVGVYTENFTQIFECTSTLTASANNVQYVSVTPVTLPRMRGYLAHWCAGTTATFFMDSAGDRGGPVRYRETNAGGLPATATPVANTGVFPIFGITRRSSP